MATMREVLSESIPKSRKKAWEAFVSGGIALLVSNGWTAGAICLGLLFCICVYDIWLVWLDKKKEKSPLVVPQGYRPHPRKISNKAYYAITSIVVVCMVSAFIFFLVKAREMRDKGPKIAKWTPPQLNRSIDKVLVNYLPMQQLYEITNLASPVQFEVNTRWVNQGFHPFSSHVSDNRLYIDLQIPTPKKPIYIKNGVITDLPDGWQWNGNSNALEIVNAEAIPVFQEFFTNENTVYINGALRSGDKVFFQDNDHQIQCLDFISGLYQDGMELKLHQYFAYPAEDNLGKVFIK